MFFFYFVYLSCFCLTIPTLFALRDTHDIATKPSPQLMVHRHGGPFRLLPHYYYNEKTEYLCGWMEQRGGSTIALSGLAVLVIEMLDIACVVGIQLSYCHIN